MRKEYDFSKGKRGAVVGPASKTRITIMLDDEVIAFYKDKAEELGTGYQTLINAALRAEIGGKGKSAADKPLTAAMLRKILREELQSS
jgi:uncharacterized protein (DUF4415 family)